MKFWSKNFFEMHWYMLNFSISFYTFFVVLYSIYSNVYPCGFLHMSPLHLFPLRSFTFSNFEISQISHSSNFSENFYNFWFHFNFVPSITPSSLFSCHPRSSIFFLLDIFLGPMSFRHPLIISSNQILVVFSVHHLCRIFPIRCQLFHSYQVHHQRSQNLFPYFSAFPFYFLYGFMLYFPN